jgi:hypothetical protein
LNTIELLVQAEVMPVKPVIDNILAVIETGRLPSPAAYGTVAVLRDGAGFSLGLHQATDGADSADEVITEYIALGGIHSKVFEAYLPRFEADESRALGPDPKTWPLWAKAFADLFRNSADDQYMRLAQDRVFERRYWAPAMTLGIQLGLVRPLSYLVLYDAMVQSGPGGVARVRRRFSERPPSYYGNAPDLARESAWTSAFLYARHDWLCNFDNGDPGHSAAVRRSSYRTSEIIAACLPNPALASPIIFRGVKVA